MIYYPIVLILFIFNFFVDAEPKFSEYPTVGGHADYIFIYYYLLYIFNII